MGGNQSGPSFRRNDFISFNTSKFKDIYDLGDYLGSWSYGDVLKATHIITGHERAVKLLNKGISRDIYNRFVREKEILLKLNHPSIIQVYEFFEDNDFYYLVLEKCDGGNLSERISNGPLSEKVAGIILKQILSAVMHMHQNGVTHRDLTLENIVIEEKEDLSYIKIVDFFSASTIKKNERLIDGNILNINYSSPEVLVNNYNEKCDEWSVGIILYQLLCGILPFSGDKLDIVKGIGNTTFLEKGPWENISKNAKDLIKKLLTKEKSRITAEKALLGKWIQSQNPLKPSNFNFLRQAMENLNKFRYVNKFHDCVTVFIINHVMTLRDTVGFRDLFVSIDINGDGKLSKKEFEVVFKNVPGYTREFPNNVMRYVDTDRNGYIEYEEFLKAVIDKEIIFSRENLEKTFKMLDLDNSGEISLNELETKFLEIGFSSNELNEIISEADENRNGEINQEEFVNFFTP